MNHKHLVDDSLEGWSEQPAGGRRLRHRRPQQRQHRRRATRIADDSAHPRRWERTRPGQVGAGQQNRRQSAPYLRGGRGFARRPPRLSEQRPGLDPIRTAPNRAGTQGRLTARIIDRPWGALVSPSEARRKGPAIGASGSFSARAGSQAIGQGRPRPKRAADPSLARRRGPCDAGVFRSAHASEDR